MPNLTQHDISRAQYEGKSRPKDLRYDVEVPALAFGLDRAEMMFTGSAPASDATSFVARSGGFSAKSRATKQWVKGGDEVTEEVIRKAMREAPLSPSQLEHSLPKIKHYVDLFLEKEGHHVSFDLSCGRYLSGAT